MKILLAGATGAVGMSLTPLLLSRGHEVVATTRSFDKAAALKDLGAQPLVLDALDRAAVVRAIGTARPDASCINSQRSHD